MSNPDQSNGHSLLTREKVYYKTLRTREGNTGPWAYEDYKGTSDTYEAALHDAGRIRIYARSWRRSRLHA